MTGATPFGVLLRQWSTSRSLSQLALAAMAGTTSRHVSFLETGRSRPSAEIVDRLADALDVPLGDRNALLLAAGLAGRYTDAAWEDERYEPARRAVGQLLAAHEPYPAIVLDRRSRVVNANAGAARLFGGDLVGANLLDRFLADDPSRWIANWPTVAQQMLRRLRVEQSRHPVDHHLAAAVDRVAGIAPPASRLADDDALVACPWFVVGDRVVRTLILAARFDNALDALLDDLRIELVYPLDDDAESFFRAASAGP